MKEKDKYLDFNEIISDTALSSLIKYSIHKSQYRSYHDLQDHTLSLFIDNYATINSHILITDKNHFYRSIWRTIINRLHEKYLPDETYAFNWFIEITPHSFFIWLTSGKNLDFTEVDKLLKKYDISDELLESNFEICFKKLCLEDCNLSIESFDRIPSSIKPKTRKEQLGLIFNLMNIPPLEELSHFVQKYQRKIASECNSIDILINLDNEPK
ncbi:hypothetical protein ONZ60_06490 [Aeromonas salmonicida]|uniref:Uncharacterized protein n=4 Tax=Aeromonas salmonicida TaxID=645 RepID=A4SQ62_AERS4|nr:hypothetical protein [Aeromonas salmonicida]ABO91034.1 hypothetical protein ASA_3033 [Aeromonas salmonicida subsp. salmonicida A449]MBM9525156.1 hypothetical protein [Aeromonas salmonicida subsp. salmonicida]MCK3680013.1 hypothetical protein [Aeromonas salmonicida subsp. salmonicida]MCR4454824.1 hypothetical protein [Aeromonas salmonicida]QEO83127.1 hypothetical protein E3D14_06545 [Aeromonas salmonicida subsp. salmonicida]